MRFLASLTSLFTIFSGLLFATDPVPKQCTPDSIDCTFYRGDGIEIGPAFKTIRYFQFDGEDADWDPFDDTRLPGADSPPARYNLPGRKFCGSVWIRVQRDHSIKERNPGFTYRSRNGGKGEPFPDDQWIAQRLLEATDLRTGPIINDDVIPVFGSLYKVVRCVRATGSPDADISLQKMPAMDWPADIELDPYGYPITPGGYIILPGSRYRVSPYGNVVRVVFVPEEQQYHLVIGHEVEGREQKLEVREANIVATKGLNFPVVTHTQIYNFKVTSVVLPDPVRHIPGWVELRRIWPQIIPFPSTSEAKTESVP